MKISPLLAACAFGLVTLAGCQSAPKAASSVPSGKSAALRSMETVAIAAHKCWFASKDPAFRPYRFANELNSMSGTPRFLLVPAKNYAGRPLLVVQAQGNSAAIDAYGPLMGEALGPRISGDLTRWKSGDTSCGANA